MPVRQSAKIGYVGRESLTEGLLPNPTEDQIERERLEAENSQLRDELKYLRSALATAGRILQPYFAKLNGTGR